MTAQQQARIIQARKEVSRLRAVAETMSSEVQRLSLMVAKAERQISALEARAPAPARPAARPAAPGAEAGQHRDKLAPFLRLSTGEALPLTAGDYARRARIPEADGLAMIGVLRKAGLIVGQNARGVTDYQLTPSGLELART